jgi:hypothetical protein
MYVSGVYTTEVWSVCLIATAVCTFTAGNDRRCTAGSFDPVTGSAPASTVSGAAQNHA